MSAMPDIQPSPRSLTELCHAAQMVNCGNCWKVPGLPCTADLETGAPGFHVARFARAMRRGLITGAELVAALAVPPSFTTATVIYDEPSQPGELDEDEEDYSTDPEPYCAACGHSIGMFLGLPGWWHFRGDPAPGGRRELYAADHDPAPAWGGELP